MKEKERETGFTIYPKKDFAIIIITHGKDKGKKYKVKI